MRDRSDISNYLIHFTKAPEGFESNEWGAFVRLINILEENCLKSNNGYIRGSQNVVCFTEAPLQSWASAFLKNYHSGNEYYSLFGLMFKKVNIYTLGGRQVVYQSDDEFSQLKESMQWRHKRYEPNNNIDFTWEREWRLKADLKLSNIIEAIIVPSKKWKDELLKYHDEDQFGKIQGLSLVLDPVIARQYYMKFDYPIISVDQIIID